MKTFLHNSKIVYFILLFSASAFGQKWGVQTFSEYTNEAYDVELDNAGNAYVAGYITGATIFSTATNQSQVAGNGDIYVAKYNPNGSLLWVKQFGGNFSDRAYDLAIGPDQNIVVTGQFFGAVGFGSFNLQSAQDSKDIFVVKMNPSGNVLWARKEGGNMAENAYAVTVDHQNNVILTGQFQGQSSIAGQNYTSLIDPLTGLYSFDLFLAKYDSNGTPLWSKAGLAHKEDRGMCVTVDNQDNIFMAGQYSDTLQFAGSTIFNTGLNVGFLTKFSPSGQIQFFNNLRAGACLPYDIKVNHNNEVLLIGDYLGNMNYYHLNIPHAITHGFVNKIFVLKTENDGSFDWAFSLGSDNELSARALAIDNVDNVYITGFFKCGLTEYHQLNRGLWNAVGFRDSYLLKVSDAGTKIYAKQYGGQDDDEGQGIAIQQIENPLICGSFARNLNTPFETNFSSTLTTNPMYNHQLTTGYNSYSYTGTNNRNSYLLKYLNAQIKDYNYFLNEPNDSLEMQINPETGIPIPGNPDTIVYCMHNRLYCNPQTYPTYGPAYTYLWNTGGTGDYIDIAQTGLFYVTNTRLDDCSSGTDSIFSVQQTIPPLPIMNDDIGLAVNQPGPSYYQYFFCQPDTVNIMFSNLCAGCTFQYHNDSTTDISLGPHTLDHTSGYYVTVTRGLCTNTGHGGMQIYTPQNLPVIQLGLIQYNPPDIGDTINICQSEDAYFFAFDSITNPSIDVNIHLPDPKISILWKLNGQYAGGGSELFHFHPIASGWYNIEVEVLMGYQNNCAVDTQRYVVSHAYYINIYPDASISGVITGPSLVCDNNQNVYLVVNPTNPVCSWSGPGIEWMSADQDSVLVDRQGSYTYSGYWIDTITGCNAHYHASHFIDTVHVPSIQAASQIICPNDSMLMHLANSYLSYNWIGPDGNQLSVINQCYGANQGFYYCHLVDQNQCQITTPPFELKEYQTPSVVVYPQNYICSNETITIEVIYTGNPIIQWSPVNMNTDIMTVNQPGAYGVSVQQCGITTVEQIVIADGSFTPLITTTDTLLCFGQSAVITGNYPNYFYSWNTGEAGSNTITVSSPGDYFATVMNDYGCQETTNVVHVSIVDGSSPPELADVTICAGDSVVFTNSSNYTLNWYDQDTTYLQTSSQLTIQNVQNDTTFLVAYQNTVCPLAFTQLDVDVLSGIPTYSVQAPPFLCQGDSATLHLQTGNLTSFHWFNGDSTHNDVVVNQPGQYWVVLEACSFQHPAYVTIQDGSFNPTIAATDSVVCVDGNMPVRIFVSPTDYSIQWNDTSLTGPFLVTSSPGMYSATVTSPLGCVQQTDTVFIAPLTCNGELLNVITPNNDGINDFFYLEEALAYHSNRLIILNRWGNVMLDERGYRNNYDAFNCVDGVYWFIFYPDPVLEPKRVKRGFFHIIR